jgi:hypothetical protein
VRWIAVDERGRLYAATPDAIYSQDAHGVLALRFRAARGSIHGLAASRARVWFAEGTELGTIDEEDHISVTAGLRLAASAKIESSTSSDVWVLDGDGLVRYTAGTGRDNWRTDVAPVFARACASCHLPEGPAGVDLSTQTAWDAHRAVLKRRVIEARTMPPRGHELSDADRDVLRHWLERAEP